MANYHRGQMLRSKTEPTWPAIIVESVHEHPTARWAGQPLPPFAFVHWNDSTENSSTITLATLDRDWEDTGV